MSYEYSDSYDWEELIDTLNNQVSKISDLEAKLAESEIKYAQLRFKQLEKDVKKYKNADKEFLGENINLKDKVRALKQQLAEKDEEIEELIAVRDDKNKVINKQTDKINKLKEELNAKETLNQIFKDNRKAEISFALEQLEKVKEWTHDNASYVLGDFASVWEDALLDELDNQIKAIKGDEVI